jgi:16S rRNA (adenine1518-N6/adenine1519-N6)-dimethyltransferase
LLGRADRVVAIELDTALAGKLRERFQEESRLEVVAADVLKTDLAQWGPAVVAGNLPYYITSPVIQRVLRFGSLWARAVFLVQKEVALRLAAMPGSRDYGYLTVLTRLFAEPEYLFNVPPHSFQPAPKVDSAVVRLTPGPARPDVEGIARFAGLCFRQKRKTLRNNLRSFVDANILADLPEGGLRAEQITVEQFENLYARLKPYFLGSIPDSGGL